MQIIIIIIIIIIIMIIVIIIIMNFIPGGVLPKLFSAIEMTCHVNHFFDIWR